MMEGRFVIWGFSVLFLSLACRSAADDYQCGTSSESLGDGCSISDDCSTITCKSRFVEKDISLTLKVNKCEDPVTVTASMDVPDLYITWSHTYTSDDIVEVPGFSISLAGFVSAGVYVQVGLTPNEDSGNLHLKVTLLGGGEILGKAVYPVKLQIIEGDLPISTDCGIVGWWNNLSGILKAAVIGGPVLLILLLIMCCYCCCCRSSPTRGGQILVTASPQAVLATSTNRTVPMRPLVNEM